MTSSGSYSYRTTMIAVVLFAVAMGYFEASIVVYLRELYYPGGFPFPLALAPKRMIVIELFREASTIVMLITVAALAGKKFCERFGYFIIIFGVWDIFYYIWLKVTINWPLTLFDWDILFLIPLPWLGPVIAPSLVALLMIVIGVSITRLFYRGFDFRPTKLTWVLAILATLVMLYSFIRDINAGLHQAMPEPYRYWMLFAGLLMYVTAYIISFKALYKNKTD